MSRRRINERNYSNRFRLGNTTSNEWKTWLAYVRDWYLKSESSNSYNANEEMVTERSNTPEDFNSSYNKDIVENDLLVVKKIEDNRPYININVLNREIIALLDTGARHSVFGEKGLKFIEEFGLKIFRSMDLNISTADGAIQTIVGYIDLPIVIENTFHVIKVLIVPSLQQFLILGSNFCNIFGIILNYNEQWRLVTF